ncbi:MAG: hypothetical protein IKZ16_04700 [Clostridia bacterium]|nr:hypothetical protein [Clostridia bacterium]MBR5880967.1 hypothetical protein [Clostridia bacterium]
MTLDRNAVNRLLALNDKQLALVIQKLVAEAGIDPATLQINPSNIAAVRAALSVATDADLEMAAKQLAKMPKDGQSHE